MTKTTSSIPFSMWRKIIMATWRPRKNPMISATVDIEAPRLLEYIDQVRDATGQHLIPMHFVGRVAGKVLEALPELNGRVVLVASCRLQPSTRRLRPGTYFPTTTQEAACLVRSNAVPVVPERP